MADVEKIEAELRARLGGATRGPFIVVPPSSRGESADIYMSRDENGTYEGWIGEMALTADAEHFAACSPENIRALLDELSRLREVERRQLNALEPFYTVAKTLPDPRLINDEAPGVIEAHVLAFKAALGKLTLGDFRRVFWLMEAASRALSAQVEERE